MDDIAVYPIQAEAADRVYRIVERMPELRRNVFLLSRIDQLTYAEIAELYRISAWRVRSMMTFSMTEARYAMDQFKPPSRWQRTRWWLAATALLWRRSGEW